MRGDDAASVEARHVVLPAAASLGFTPFRSRPPTEILLESLDSAIGGSYWLCPDLERALAFYRALGFESKGAVATEYAGDDTHPAGAIAMIHLKGGQILSLYPRSDLAIDAGLPTGPPGEERRAISWPTRRA